MKILLVNFLLFVGLSQVLARSIPWIHSHDAWMDDDYDLFRPPSNQPIDEFYNLMLGDISDESKELERADDRDYENKHHGGFFGTLLGSFLEIEEEAANSNENTQSKSNEKTENTEDDADDDQNNKLFNIVLNELFDADEENSSEEKPKFIAKENKESEEEIETLKSKEDSDEVTPILLVGIFDLTKSSEEKEEAKSAEDENIENSNEATEITDLTKTSAEHKTEQIADDLSEMDVNELVTFFITLDLLSDMSSIIETSEAKDEVAISKEVDEILKVFRSVLDKEVEEALQPKLINSAQAEDEEIIETTTAKNKSDEDEDRNEATTTPKYDSSERNDDAEQSNSSEENEANFIDFEFKTLDGDSNQQPVEEHKYSVINLPQESVTTSSPYLAEKSPVTLSTSDAQNSINEYVKIRENLDEQQDFLKKHDFDLDKDFYAIISNDLNDNSLNKFEKDINVAQENLDRIKKNINAMQNLQTKLYFYKLVTNAVKETQPKLEY